MKSKNLVPFMVVALSLAVSSWGATASTPTSAPSATPSVSATMSPVTTPGTLTQPAGSGLVSLIQPDTQAIEEIPLSQMAQASVGGKTVQLKRVGAGLRQKKVALFWVDVYVGQTFTNSAVDVSSVPKYRESLTHGFPVVLSMTFMRNIGIGKINDAYSEAMEINGIDKTKKPFAEFLKAVTDSGDIKNKQVVVFFISPEGSQYRMSFQTAGKEQFSTVGDVALMDSFLKMWVGEPADSGIAKFQQHLLGK